jgi:hypothetical protein
VSVSARSMIWLERWRGRRDLGFQGRGPSLEHRAMHSGPVFLRSCAGYTYGYLFVEFGCCAGKDPPPISSPRVSSVRLTEYFMLGGLGFTSWRSLSFSREIGKLLFVVVPGVSDGLSVYS